MGSKTGRNYPEATIIMIKRLFQIMMVALALMTPVVTHGAGLSVKARLDSVQMLMGNMTTLHLEVVQSKGRPGGFPIFSNPGADGIVGVCGDSVELRTSIHRDTVDLGSGKIQINYKVPVQAFDSGAYRLPEFVYVSDRDSAFSNRVSLKIVPMNVTAEDPIAGFAPVAEPEDKSIFDNVPDWLADYWWLILIILLAAAGGWWAVKRYRKEGTLLKKKPTPDPYQVAMKRLGELKDKKLWEKGMEREYFTELTEILRQYLDSRFGINAMEMTSRQIMDALSSNAEIKEKRGYMRQILNVADFVKFAKVRPLPADNVEAFDNAWKFVEETKPQPEPEENAGKEVADPKNDPKEKGGKK